MIEITSAEKKSLSFLYERFIFPNIRLLAQGQERDVLEYITDRSLRFGYYSVVLHPSKFGCISRDVTLPGLCMLQTSLRRARLSLKDNGFLFYDYHPLRSCDPIEYTVNVPGIGGALLPIYMGSKRFIEYKEIFEVAVARFREAGIQPTPITGREEYLMKIQEAANQGVLQSFHAMNKKAKKDLTSKSTANYIGSVCKEHGVTYFEDVWTKRLTGNLKQFLKECSQRVEDPKEVLRNVISCWHDVRLSVVSPNGNKVPLPSTFSFKDFFTWRSELMQLTNDHIRIRGDGKKKASIYGF